jgi:hypothetical protein
MNRRLATQLAAPRPSRPPVHRPRLVMLLSGTLDLVSVEAIASPASPAHPHEAED